jgi:hypothetical protein
MTQWKWQVAIFVPSASKTAAEEMSSVVAGHPQENTFAVELSATGDGPATHYGCCTWATDEYLARMQAALPGVAGAAFYRMDSSGICVASSSPSAIGSAWSWAQSLGDAGLRCVSYESPNA